MAIRWRRICYFICVILISVEPSCSTDIEHQVTSVHQMELLYRVENSYVSQLTVMADRLESTIQSMRMYAGSFQDVTSYRGDSKTVHHPVHAHLLIRHMTVGWPTLKKALDTLHDHIQTLDYLRLRQNMPSQEELEMTELALVRLIGTYRFNPIHFARGNPLVNGIQSGKRLSVWDLGRISIGLLNQQYFAPAVEMVDESIRMLQEAQQDQRTARDADLRGFVMPGSVSTIVPKMVNEHVRVEDLLAIKYQAAKQHDVMLSKLWKGHIESCGEGLVETPYNQRSFNALMNLSASAVPPVFRHHCDLQSDKTSSSLMDRERTLRLCRGQELRDSGVLSKLRCRLSGQTFPPSKIEEVSIEPVVFLVHDAMPDIQMREIIKASGFKLKGAGNIPSMSFKSAAFDVSVGARYACIKRLEQLTGGQAQLRRDDESSLVLNYGVGGTYGLHTDYRGNYSNTSAGERQATAMIYLTHVAHGGFTVFPRIGALVRPRKGSALIFWNTDAAGQIDSLTVHSDCPLVYGNKWVLLHWINGHSKSKTAAKIDGPDQE